jgi:Protein of unknown function (DUF2911)
MSKAIWGAVAALMLRPAAGVEAQSLASPFATVTQRVDSTTITIEYYRPSARGRTIFGALVRWGDLWTPGANWATTLEVSRDVRIEGHPLPRGKYSLWLIPVRSPDPWTVVLSRAARRFHVVRPDPQDDALRFSMPADSGPYREMLTFSFPLVTRGEATLAFEWAGTVMPLRFDVGSSRSAAVAAHPWSSYTGVYELRGPDDDSTTAPIRYEILELGTGLWVHTAADAVEPGLDTEFDLLPAGGDTFHPRQYKSGKLIGDELDELIVFQVEGSRATGFEIRGIAEARVLARATRARP